MDILRTYLKAERGRLSRLAEAIQLSPATIHGWHQVPAERVNAVAKFTGIPREQLRPDIFTEIS
jgi:DNA-binding transcriptional regulator YdaS (Cro superfamily)